MLTFTTHRLDNGMTVVVEPMPWQRTAAFALTLGGGVVAEPVDRSGLAGMVCEMVQRGAGSHSSRDLVAVQDNLGIDRNSGVSTTTTSFGGAMPADSLSAAIELYADILRRPHLPGDQLDDARAMMVQELRALQDEPTHRVMRRLRQLHYGDRLGRSSHGDEAGLSAITSADVRDFFTNTYHAGGAILGIAGNVDVPRILDEVEAAFGDWKSGDVAVPPRPTGAAAQEHIDAPGAAQTHIGFAFKSVPYGHDDYFRMRAGIGILSDGMSSRLFDRVREQRGLCYTVSAGCHSLPHAGGVFGYAGTTPARAQETLDVTLREIAGLADDLHDDELARWKVRIESGLIMEQESSASRASSLANDVYQLGRPIPTDQLERMIEQITLGDVRDYWAEHPPVEHRIVTFGPDPLILN